MDLLKDPQLRGLAKDLLSATTEAALSGLDAGDLSAMRLGGDTLQDAIRRREAARIALLADARQREQFIQEFKTLLLRGAGVAIAAAL